MIRAVLPFTLLLLAVPAQEPPPPPPANPELPELLKQLKSHVTDSKMAEDPRAVGLVIKLTKEPATLNPKDKQSIAKALGDLYGWGKVRPPDRPQLYHEAAKGLGRLGTAGSKPLQQAIESKRLDTKEHVPIRCEMLLELGNCNDPEQAKFLLEMATRSSIDEIMAAAGEALGSISAMPIKQRREVVKDLIRKWGGLESVGSQLDSTDPSAPIDFAPQNARATLGKIRPGWTRTLERLTGQRFSNFEEWQRWLNKAGNWTTPGAPEK